MEPVKNLIHEIHRRSLWQILAIFLATSWAVLQVVEVLTETAGLPDWTPTMALVLLLIGLPICLATAFVQEGMPGHQSGGTDVPEATPEPTEAEPNQSAGTGSLDRPSTRPSLTTMLFTWRNALLGGLGALVLLGLSLAAYFVMWSTGVGPVGNLVAQGVMSEGERVILADFTDGTGEGYAAPITEALRIDLLEAALFAVVDDSEIRPTLALMRVEPGAPLTSERARDVAARLGIAAVLEGEVTSLGTGYSVTATLRATDSGRSLAGFRVTAGGSDELIRATDQLSQDIREKSGESLRTIRTGQPLEQVTTTSIEALKLYTEALVAQNEMADSERAGMLIEQALLRDSTFAMAWRQLAISGQGEARQLEAVASAYRYREKLPELERYLIEALYYQRVKLDRAAAIEAYENALLIDPDEPRALNNVAILYYQLGDWERAHERILHGVSGSSVPASVFLNLLIVEVFQGRTEDARRTLRDWEDRLPGNVWSGRYSAALSLAEGNVAAAVSQARARMDEADVSTFERAWSGRLLGRALSWSGQLEEARMVRQQSDALARQWTRGTGWQSRVETAYDEALLGDVEWARQYVNDALNDEFAALPATGPYRFRTAMALGMAGDPEAVERMIQEWQGSTREEWQGPTFRAMAGRALLQARVARGESNGISETVERLLEGEGCSDACWLFERAVLHDRIADYEQAAALYERVVQEGFLFQTPPEGNIVEILNAKLRLGPLYEEMGDTVRAVEAYQRMIDQWAAGDARAQETVRRFRERIAELGG